MKKPAEQMLTPENYARMLKEAQATLGQAEGSDLLHHFAINQGFKMNGMAKVAGVKWVKGEVQSDGVLVEGMNAKDPFQLTFFKNPT